MLPGMDGLKVCHTLRNESDIPIIMLTARIADEDKLAGLGLGADDYVGRQNTITCLYLPGGDEAEVGGGTGNDHQQS
jgi:DNA-binding response OmpR family regulator